MNDSSEIKIYGKLVNQASDAEERGIAHTAVDAILVFDAHYVTEDSVLGEYQDVINNELSGRLLSETQQRVASDLKLENDLYVEKTNRENGDTNLSTRIDNLNKIVTDNKSDIETKLTAESQAREDGDNTTYQNAQNYTNKAIDDLKGGAPAAYDTLKEIADYIDSDTTATAALLKRVSRTDYKSDDESNDGYKVITNKIDTDQITVGDTEIGTSSISVAGENDASTVVSIDGIEHESYNEDSYNQKNHQDCGIHFTDDGDIEFYSEIFPATVKVTDIVTHDYAYSTYVTKSALNNKIGYDNLAEYKVRPNTDDESNYHLEKYSGGNAVFSDFHGGESIQWSHAAGNGMYETQNVILSDRFRNSNTEEVTDYCGYSIANPSNDDTLLLTHYKFNQDGSVTVIDKTVKDTYDASAVQTLIDAKADAANVYNKSEIDGKMSAVNSAISNKADASNVYTKSEVDNAVKNVTVDAYTKAETDTLLGNKANSTDVYTKDNTYSKTEVDSKVSDIKSSIVSDTNTTYTLNLSTYAGNATDSSINATGEHLVVYGTLTDNAGNNQNAKAVIPAAGNAAPGYMSSADYSLLHETGVLSDITASSTTTDTDVTISISADGNIEDKSVSATISAVTLQDAGVMTSAMYNQLLNLDENTYTKSEIDGKISSINSDISSINTSLDSKASNTSLEDLITQISNLSARVTALENGGTSTGTASITSFGGASIPATLTMTSNTATYDVVGTNLASLTTGTIPEIAIDNITASQTSGFNIVAEDGKTVGSKTGTGTGTATITGAYSGGSYKLTIDCPEYTDNRSESEKNSTITSSITPVITVRYNDTLIATVSCPTWNGNV